MFSADLSSAEFFDPTVPIIGSIDAGSDAQESGAETKNGAADDDDNSDSLSDSDPVCITDQKAPPA